MAELEVIPAHVERAAQGLAAPVRSIRRLSGGLINEAFVVETESETAVLRISPRTRAPRQLRFEVALLQHLCASGARVPTPLLLASGSYIGETNGHPFVAFGFLPGAPVSDDGAADVPPEALAHLLAPVFSGLRTFAPPFRPVRETRVFAARIPALIESLAHDPPRAIWVQALFAELAGRELDLTLPTAAVHADIHPGNVLLADADLSLVDFDDAHVGVRAQDPVLAALEFSFRNGVVDESRFDSLLDALLVGPEASGERAEVPFLRKLVCLKFAATLAALGTSADENRYLRALGA